MVVTALNDYDQKYVWSIIKQIRKNYLLNKANPECQESKTLYIDEYNCIKKSICGFRSFNNHHPGPLVRNHLWVWDHQPAWP